MVDSATLLELCGIGKVFPGVKALDGVDFDLECGEVHALIGENGAGKSTLMKILGGIYQPDAGVIRIDGRDTVLDGPAVAARNGIGMVHQEPKLCGSLSVTENVLMGKLPLRHGAVDWGEAHRLTGGLLSRVGMTLDPRDVADSLSIAQRQLVQIAKALAQSSRLIILDEPTASLTPVEVRILFGVVEELRAQDVAFIYISHHLDEIFRIARRVTVLKDGKTVARRLVTQTNKAELIGLMVGRELGNRFPPRGRIARDVAMEVRNLTGRGFQDVSLTIRRGEVLGIAGLVGAGRTELARALCGADRSTAGEIRIAGEAVTLRNPADAIRRGIAYIAEDRKDGLFMPRPVRENMTTAIPGAISRFGVINLSRERGIAERFIQQLNVRTPGTEQPIRFLSGGNQQKCILARWIVKGVDVLFLDEPTRGIDVGAKSEIYRLVDELAGSNKAVVLISSELPEVLGMADRIVVMCGGRVSGELSAAQASEQAVLALALPQVAAQAEENHA